MSFQEKVVEILQERSFEIHDGASKMNVIEASDFEQIALDLVELLNVEYGVDPEELEKKVSKGA
ncbi:MAG: hypothetical protein KA116_09280 [Proteobacteria bacterium]|nr:hypothetical protein [Pseudomonadota bacterium]